MDMDLYRKEIYGMQLRLSEFDFVHYDMMKFADETFQRFFKDDIELQDFNYAPKNEGMGWFKLKYRYKPKEYQIVFENARLVFSIRVTDTEGYHTSLYKTEDGIEFDNGLTKENIEIAIKYIEMEIQKEDICFYISKNNKLYKKEKGIIKRVKNPYA